MVLVNRHGVYPRSSDGTIHAGAYVAATYDGQLSVMALCGATTYILETRGGEPNCDACRKVDDPDAFDLPAMCAQCGARPQDLERAKRQAWTDSRSELCPRCLGKWFEAKAPGAQLPRCAGCGRRVHTLHGGVCADCKSLGVEAPMLFEGPGT